MTTYSVVKDPDAVLDYAIYWCDDSGTNVASDDGWLNGDTIVSASWSVDGPDSTLVIDSSSIVDWVNDAAQTISTDTGSRVWLSGGTVNRSYTVTLHITTTESREDDRSITVKVVER